MSSQSAIVGDSDISVGGNLKTVPPELNSDDSMPGDLESKGPGTQGMDVNEVPKGSVSSSKLPKPQLFDSGQSKPAMVSDTWSDLEQVGQSMDMRECPWLLPPWPPPFKGYLLEVEESLTRMQL